MSDQDMEMQFADPDWQPASSRQGRSPREQSLSVPVEIKKAPDPRKPTDQSGSVDTSNRGKAGAYGDYSQGYRAASSNDHHDEQPARIASWNSHLSVKSLRCLEYSLTVDLYGECRTPTWCC